MNKSDPLEIARQQLSGAISNFQTPTCDPLKVSPWIAMSLLQKAIRRGHEQLALRAAATLLRISPERLWRRCGCIALLELKERPGLAATAAQFDVSSEPHELWITSFDESYFLFADPFVGRANSVSKDTSRSQVKLTKKISPRGDHAAARRSTSA